jgi:hypothetical protein
VFAVTVGGLPEVVLGIGGEVDDDVDDEADEVNKGELFDIGGEWLVAAVVKTV